MSMEKSDGDVLYPTSVPGRLSPGMESIVERAFLIGAAVSESRRALSVNGHEERSTLFVDRPPSLRYATFAERRRIRRDAPIAVVHTFNLFEARPSANSLWRGKKRRGS